MGSVQVAVLSDACIRAPPAELADRRAAVVATLAVTPRMITVMDAGGDGGSGSVTLGDCRNVSSVCVAECDQNPFEWDADTLSLNNIVGAKKRDVSDVDLDTVVTVMDVG